MNLFKLFLGLGIIGTLSAGINMISAWNGPSLLFQTHTPFSLWSLGLTILNFGEAAILSIAMILIKGEEAMKPYVQPKHFIKFIEVTCECGETFDSLPDFDSHQEDLNKKGVLKSPGPEFLGEEAA